MTYGEKIELFAELQNELYRIQMSVLKAREHGVRVACAGVVSECDKAITALNEFRAKMAERGIK
jgi:hypothetical protein